MDLEKNASHLNTLCSGSFICSKAIQDHMQSLCSQLDPNTVKMELLKQHPCLPYWKEAKTTFTRIIEVESDLCFLLPHFSEVFYANIDQDCFKVKLENNKWVLSSKLSAYKRQAANLIRLLDSRNKFRFFASDFERCRFLIGIDLEPLAKYKKLFPSIFADCLIKDRRCLSPNCEMIFPYHVMPIDALQESLVNALRRHSVVEASAIIEADRDFKLTLDPMLAEAFSEFFHDAALNRENMALFLRALFHGFVFDLRHFSGSKFNFIIQEISESRFQLASGTISTKALANFVGDSFIDGMKDEQSEPLEGTNLGIETSLFLSLTDKLADSLGKCQFYCDILQEIDFVRTLRILNQIHVSEIAVLNKNPDPYVAALIDVVLSLGLNQEVFLYGGFLGHAIKLKLKRLSQYDYDLLVYNSGSGVDYHGFPVVGIQQFAVPLSVKLSLRRDQKSAAFIFLLVRGASLFHDSEDLYRFLLTWGKDIVTDPLPGLTKGMVPQRSGTCTVRSTSMLLYDFMGQRNYKTYSFMLKLLAIESSIGEICQFSRYEIVKRTVKKLARNAVFIHETYARPEHELEAIVLRIKRLEAKLDAGSPNTLLDSFAPLESVKLQHLAILLEKPINRANYRITELHSSMEVMDRGTGLVAASVEGRRILKADEIWVPVEVSWSFPFIESYLFCSAVYSEQSETLLLHFDRIGFTLRLKGSHITLGDYNVEFLNGIAPLLRSVDQRFLLPFVSWLPYPVFEAVADVAVSHSDRLKSALFFLQGHRLMESFKILKSIDASRLVEQDCEILEAIQSYSSQESAEVIVLNLIAFYLDKRKTSVKQKIFAHRLNDYFEHWKDIHLDLAFHSTAIQGYLTTHQELELLRALPVTKHSKHRLDFLEGKAVMQMEPKLLKGRRLMPRKSDEFLWLSRADIKLQRNSGVKVHIKSRKMAEAVLSSLLVPEFVSEVEAYIMAHCVLVIKNHPCIESAREAFEEAIFPPFIECLNDSMGKVHLKSHSLPIPTETDMKVFESVSFVDLKSMSIDELDKEFIHLSQTLQSSAESDLFHLRRLGTIYDHKSPISDPLIASMLTANLDLGDRSRMHNRMQTEHLMQIIVEACDSLVYKEENREALLKYRCLSDTTRQSIATSRPNLFLRQVYRNLTMLDDEKIFEAVVETIPLLDLPNKKFVKAQVKAKIDKDLNSGALQTFQKALDYLFDDCDYVKKTFKKHSIQSTIYSAGLMKTLMLCYETYKSRSQIVTMLHSSPIDKAVSDLDYMRKHHHESYFSSLGTLIEIAFKAQDWRTLLLLSYGLPFTFLCRQDFEMCQVSQESIDKAVDPLEGIVLLQMLEQPIPQDLNEWISSAVDEAAEHLRDGRVSIVHVHPLIVRRLANEYKLRDTDKLAADFLECKEFQIDVLSSDTVTDSMEMKSCLIVPHL